MDDENISVHWRASVMPLDGKQASYGRLSKIGKGMAIVKVGHNFHPGHRCNLSVMLPKSRPDEAPRFIEADGVVSVSVLSSFDFCVTLSPLKMKGNGRTLLDEQIMKYNEGRRKN
jgi:hypothetical protein